jgi:hypothetical protein
MFINQCFIVYIATSSIQKKWANKLQEKKHSKRTNVCVSSNELSLDISTVVICNDLHYKGFIFKSVRTTHSMDLFFNSSLDIFVSDDVSYYVGRFVHVHCISLHWNRWNICTLWWFFIWCALLLLNVRWFYLSCLNQCLVLIDIVNFVIVSML